MISIPHLRSVENQIVVSAFVNDLVLLESREEAFLIY